MKRSDLIHNLSKEFQPLTKKETQAFIESVFDEIGNALAEGKTVKFNTYLHLSTKSLKFLKRRNPKTGEDIYLTDRKVVSFKPGLRMKQALNKFNQ